MHHFTLLVLHVYEKLRYGDRRIKMEMMFEYQGKQLTIEEAKKLLKENKEHLSKELLADLEKSGVILTDSREY
jgi:hypothetical protein